MKRTLILVTLAISLYCQASIYAQDGAPAANALAPGAATAVPRLIRFSGTLRPEGAIPVRGVVEISFSLFKEESGGEPLWFETQTVEVDALGRYNVLLGAMHADGLPMDLFTSGEARWLSVMVGKIEQPRILLVSVPYALKAGDAATLGGKPATAFVATEQLKEQVASAISDPRVGLRSVDMMVARAGTGSDMPPALINETVPATFTCTSASNCVAVTQNGNSNALFATTTGTNGVVAAVRGDSASTAGRGIFGFAAAATGQTFGVFGQSSSTSGRGIFGYATAASGATYGIFGASTSTGGVGIRAQAVSATGSTFGLIAESYSPNGIAAVISGLGGGKLISARTTGSVEKFAVAGIGNVTTAGTVSGTQFISTIATGTAPLQVTSTTLVPNLFVARSALADMAADALKLGGQSASSYALRNSANSFLAGQSIVASAAGAKGLDVQVTDLTELNTAISGRADGADGVGVVGEANLGTFAIGVWGRSDSGYAGYFDGNVTVTGNVDIIGTITKAGGSFKIDHPLDPAHKYLQHSFVESPDMMNMYNGNATLDAHGEATIELPEWFEALNQDFRYQLTAIGAPGPNLFISAKIQSNRFRIAGGSPGMEVSWQVTGVRHDAWANAHRIPVETEKSAGEKGFYLHPQIFGAPAEQSISRELHHGRTQRTYQMHDELR